MLVMRWARANGYPWDARSRAADARHLKVLQWAIANGCPWSPEECLYCGRSQIVVWIASEVDLSGMDEEVLRIAVRAAAREDDVGLFEKLPAYWKHIQEVRPHPAYRKSQGSIRRRSRTASLLAGPRCARLARAKGVRLDPRSVYALRRVLAWQVAVGVILKGLPLPRESLLKVFRRADFLWVPQE
jgi:hypothetical protein